MDNDELQVKRLSCSAVVCVCVCVHACVCVCVCVCTQSFPVRFIVILFLQKLWALLEEHPTPPDPD